MSKFENITRTDDKSIVDLIPFIDVTEEDVFLLKNDIILDFVQIQTKDLISTSPDEVEADNLSFAKSYRTYQGDLKLVSMNYPTDTKIQQQFFLHKIETTSNAVFKDELNRQVKNLQWLEKHTTQREYYLFFYSNSKETYVNNLTVILTSLGVNGLAKKLPMEKKIQILYKLYNPCSSIFI